MISKQASKRKQQGRDRALRLAHVPAGPASADTVSRDQRAQARDFAERARSELVVEFLFATKEQTATSNAAWSEVLDLLAYTKADVLVALDASTPAQRATNSHPRAAEPKRRRIRLAILTSKDAPMLQTEEFMGRAA